MQNGSRILLPLLIGLMLLSAACAPSPGPLETAVIAAEERLGELQNAEVDRKAYTDLLRGSLQFLDEKQFTHERDLERKEIIMYRGSLVGAVAGHALGNKKAARGLYMNAYLLKEATALQDLREKLPAGADDALFVPVRIPSYEILGKTAQAGDVRVRLKVKEELPYFLVQMVCGAVLRDLQAKDDAKKTDAGERAEVPGIQKLLVEVNSPTGLIARGRWDQASDEIVVTMK